MQIKPNDKMISVARKFFAAHTRQYFNVLNNWHPHDCAEDEKLMAIYANLIAGVYGECRIASANLDEYEIEIPSCHRDDGAPYLFNFTPV